MCSGLKRVIQALLGQRLRVSRLAFFAIVLSGPLASGCVPEGDRTRCPLHSTKHPRTGDECAPEASCARSRIVKDDDGAASRSQRTTESNGERAEDEAAILALVSAFADAWNEHDAKALADTFADDATLSSASGRLARGRSNIDGHRGERDQRHDQPGRQANSDYQIRHLCGHVQGG